MMVEKSKWQKEFEALPEWGQKMVRAASGIVGHGVGPSDLAAALSPSKNAYTVSHVILENAAFDEWNDALREMLALAAALTAPWPPPDAPKREKRLFNVVELAADVEGEDCAFDQPCAFGHRVEYHAVYCHNEAWPNSPRKCRRNRTDYRHEDCPGFVRNPDADL